MNLSTNTKAYSFDEVRKKYPNAFEKWSKHEDALLLELRKQGVKISNLCSTLKRSEGAISSRIRKLENPEKNNYSGLKRANHLFSDITFDWIPVLREEDEIYMFPNPITPYMKRLYKSPSIYRWNIHKGIPTSEKIIYIGEGQQLVPARIKGYLNPGPSQMTNKRLNNCFFEYKQRGYEISLEIIRFDAMNLGDSSFNLVDLENKYLRRFLENMLIIYYQQKGYILQNR